MCARAKEELGPSVLGKRARLQTEIDIKKKKHPEFKIHSALS